MNGKHKRRWFRFSLRTLLVLVTIACVGFGWLGMKMRQKHRERAAVEAIQKTSGFVLYDHAFDPDGSTITSLTPPGPNWLRKLVGDDVLTNVAFVTYDSEATEIDLRPLADLEHLKSLRLFSTQVTDDELVHLVGLKHLEQLHAGTTRITNAGLINLISATQLKSLILSETRITDAGLVHLRGLNRLKSLDLSGTKVTDAGLIHLIGLTKLELLRIGDTRVTDAGAKELQKALPLLKIGW